MSYKGVEGFYKKNQNLFTTPSKIQTTYISYLAECLIKLGKYQKAISLLKTAETIKAQAFQIGDEPEQLDGFIQESLGECWYSLGEVGTALEYHKKALKIRKIVYFDEEHQHHIIAKSLVNIGNCLASLEQCEAGIQKHKKALSIQEAVFGKKHPLIATTKINLASCYSQIKLPKEALSLYEEALEIRESFLGNKHTDTLFARQSISICNNSLYIIDEKVKSIARDQFNRLIVYAYDVLRILSTDQIKFEKNPSGFLRYRLQVPADMSGEIETIRLHYWPIDFSINVVEAQHTHPNYFESMMLKGNYTHRVFVKNESGLPFKVYRMIKNSQAERNIIYLGKTKLEHDRDETVTAGNIVKFPRTLIHQVLKTEPDTLTINCVYKNREENFFDVFTPTSKFVDPQTEREILDSETAEPVLMRIQEILNDFIEARELIL